MSEHRQLEVLGNDGIQTVEATIATEPPWELRLAYQPATMDDLVDIFDPADCAGVVTVEQHREAMERRYDR